MTDDLRAACAHAMHVITADGEVLRAGRAALFVLERSGWSLSSRVLRWPPFIWGVELGYWIVARNRRLFGRFMFRNE